MKKIVKKEIKEKKDEKKGVKIGKVTHYFDKIGVAVVKLSKPLSVGDKIKIIGHNKEFTQTVTSIQTEHEPLKKAKAKSEVGMKVDKPVSENNEVYKVDE